MTSPTHLAAVADNARARGAHAAAVTAFARSAELTTQHGLRATRMLSAGESAWLAGQPGRADALLEKATVLATDRATLAEIDDLRGNLALLSGSLDEGREMLLRAAELSESSDPDATVMRLADVISGCFYQVQHRWRYCRRRPRGATRSAPAGPTSRGSAVRW